MRRNIERGRVAARGCAKEAMQNGNARRAAAFRYSAPFAREFPRRDDGASDADDTPNVRAGLPGDGRRGAPANLSACPGGPARPPSHPLNPRGDPDRRTRDLDHLQRRRRSGAQGRMRWRHGRLLRGGRPHDRFLPHVWLVAAGDRLRPSKARATLRAILGRKGLDVLRQRQVRPRSSNRVASGVCRSSTSFRFTISSPGRRICRRSSR